eukprot:Gregarina_sp_Poly_1__2237@NODE_159_length_12283_cov_147_306729_g141_i0_p13_GENE_NODE_159_length_12283_cov_147_306729_g141_i0NODE_159_length_12283_cov_147_306729_g141_i0_p13_ORF_typecomplete_len115_score12_36Pro_racemase/PF05544_11/0_12_NODE_159_length_12283_cov_147_306729_g141_i054265770
MSRRQRTRSSTWSLSRLILANTFRKCFAKKSNQLSRNCKFFRISTRSGTGTATRTRIARKSSKGFTSSEPSMPSSSLMSSRASDKSNEDDDSSFESRSPSADVSSALSGRSTIL